jgi:hypothetical protein
MPNPNQEEQVAEVFVRINSEEQRDRQFSKLQQAHVLNLIHWHDFLSILKQSEFTGANLISSQTTVYYKLDGKQSRQDLSLSLLLCSLSTNFPL